MLTRNCIIALTLIIISHLVYGQDRHTKLKIRDQIFHLSLDSGVLHIHKSAKKATWLAKEYYSSYLIQDVDGDGYQDILAETGGGNTPAVFDLYKYDASTQWFKMVKNFDHFPDPKPVYKTPYYYSYHKNGCADACWESDLFYIKNYQAVRIANIDCEFSGADQGAISVYKIINSERKLIQTYQVNIVDQYKNSKWGFVKNYWSNNYKGFL